MIRRVEVRLVMDVPYVDDGDGTPPAPLYSDRQLEKYLLRRLSVKWEPDCHDVEAMSHEDVPDASDPPA